MPCVHVHVPKQRSSSSSKERALSVLSGPGGASAWLDEWLRGGPEVWGGGGRTGMPEVGGAGAGANAGDELTGVSISARSMRVPWLLQWLFPEWVDRRGTRAFRVNLVSLQQEAGPCHSC